MKTYTKIATHDTDPSLYDQLSRVFGETVHQSDTSPKIIRWVTFTVDGVEMHFFAPNEAKA